MGSKKGILKKQKKNNGSLNSVASPVASDSHGRGEETVTDPRFSSVHTDPRFSEAPKRKTKVPIDSRFYRMFTDKTFLPSSAPVDKRGKPQKQNSRLRRYYKIDDEGKLEDKEEVEGRSDEDEEEKQGHNSIKSNGLKADAGGESEESSESEDLDYTSELESSTDTDEDEVEDEEVYYQKFPDMREEVPEIKKETHRLAVVNMDWRYVKAVDLYVMFSSFAPPNGQIKFVAVYPSEFGIQRMKEEEVHGPVGLFDDEGDSSDGDIENEKLRAYERSRMRYYYAVVECDSSTTADYIYKECNGVELSHSSNALDLRFIPDSMEIKHSPRDVATEAPKNYEGKDFYVRALQNSKVLSWDEDDPLRANTMKRIFDFNDEQLAELELKEFLDSDESESDGDETRMREKYLSLLQSDDGSNGDGEEDGQVGVSMDRIGSDLGINSIRPYSGRVAKIQSESARNLM